MSLSLNISAVYKYIYIYIYRYVIMLNATYKGYVVHDHTDVVYQYIRLRTTFIYIYALFM